MITGKLPYFTILGSDLLKKIKEESNLFSDPAWEGVSEECKDFV